MRCSSTFVLAGGFALGAAIIPLAASAGVFGAGANAGLGASPVVDVSWQSQLPVDEEAWHGLGQDQRTMLRQQWQTERHSASQGDQSPMNGPLTHYKGGLPSSSSSAMSGPNFTNPGAKPLLIPGIGVKDSGTGLVFDGKDHMLWQGDDIRAKLALLYAHLLYIFKIHASPC